MSTRCHYFALFDNVYPCGRELWGRESDEKSNLRSFVIHWEERRTARVTEVRGKSFLSLSSISSLTVSVLTWLRFRDLTWTVWFVSVIILFLREFVNECGVLTTFYHTSLLFRLTRQRLCSGSACIPVCHLFVLIVGMSWWVRALFSDWPERVFVEHAETDINRYMGKNTTSKYQPFLKLSPPMSFSWGITGTWGLAGFSKPGLSVKEQVGFCAIQCDLMFR